MPTNELHISAWLKHCFEYGILGYPGAMVRFICCVTEAKPKHQRASQSGNPCQILSYRTISVISVLFLGMHDGMNMLQTRPSRWNIVSFHTAFLVEFIVLECFGKLRCSIVIWDPAALVESLATSTRRALALEEGKHKRVNPPRWRWLGMCHMFYWCK